MLLMASQLIVTIDGGVAVEIDAKAVPIRAVINRNRQILDRTRRNHMSLGSTAKETEIVIESHEIDGWTEPGAAGDDMTQLSADVRCLEARMFHDLADLLGGLRHDLGEAHACAHRQTQRQQVCSRARNLPRGRRARTYRQREKKILRSGHAMKENRRGRHDDARKARPQSARGPVEAIEISRRHARRRAEKAIR